MVWCGVYISHGTTLSVVHNTWNNTWCGVVVQVDGDGQLGHVSAGDVAADGAARGGPRDCMVREWGSVCVCRECGHVSVVL